MKNVPQAYYNEMVQELAHRILQAKRMVKFQQDRIDEVLKSGKDHETSFNDRIIPLSKLYEFLESAKEEEKRLPEFEKQYQEFKAKHRPVKELKGNLQAAKLAAEVAYFKGRRTDYRYDLLHKISNKYYLSEKQMNQLMDHFYKIGIEF